MRYSSIFLSFAILAASLFAHMVVADPHGPVRGSLVFIEAVSTPEQGDNAGVPNATESQSTGFSITEDGFVLTSHHLLDKHAELKGTRLKITGRFMDYQGVNAPYTLTLVQADPFLDVVLLKARLGVGEKVASMKLYKGFLNLLGDALLYTSGFPGLTYKKDAGSFIDDQGKVSHLKQVNFKVGPGQSGSPVYLEDGRVIGIIKGTLKNPADGSEINDKSVFVPIELATAVTAHIRFRELEMQNAQLSNEINWFKQALGYEPQEITEGEDAHSRLQTMENHMEAVASNFVWRARIDKEKNVLRINYDKLIGGYIQVEKIGLQIDAQINEFKEDANGVERIIPTLQETVLILKKEEDRLVRVGLENKKRRGKFEHHEFEEVLKTPLRKPGVQQVPRGTPKISNLSLSIVPFDANGNKITPPDRVVIRCILDVCVNR